MEIYERMFRIMEQKNIKAIQLANKLNITKGVISNWKKRKTNPPIEYTVLICELLGISIEYFITGKENNFTQEELKLLENFRLLEEEEQEMILKKIKKLLPDEEASVLDPKEEEKLSS